MGGAARKRIVVEIDPGDPISGSISSEDEAKVDFVGLMQLVAAIEAARVGPVDAPDAVAEVGAAS